MKGIFLKSPTGTHRLAYSVGERADLSFLDSDVIEDLIDSKIFAPDKQKGSGEEVVKEVTNKKTKEFKAGKMTK